MNKKYIDCNYHIISNSSSNSSYWNSYQCIIVSPLFIIQHSSRLGAIIYAAENQKIYYKNIKNLMQ